MKLAYIHNTPPEANEANLTQVISMCRAFFDHGICVYLLLPEDKMAVTEAKIFLQQTYSLPETVNVFLMPKQSKSRRLNKYRIVKALPALIMRIHPDICFVRNPNFLQMCIKLKYKTIFEAHNSRMHHGLKIFNYYLSRKLIRSASNDLCIAFIAISENLARYWQQKGVKKDKILALHDGVDLSMFTMKIEKKSARKKLKLPLNKTIITYTGNLYQNRGTLQIIDLAFCFPSVVFLVVGGTESEIQKHKQYAMTKNVTNIIFSGFIRHVDVPEHLLASDILLAIWTSDVPTINYCSPLKVFEYMASEKIIVAVGFPTIKEVLFDGVSALLSEPDDIASLKSRIESAILLVEKNDLQLARNAKSIVCEKYSWEKRVTSLLQIIENHLYQ